MGKTRNAGKGKIKLNYYSMRQGFVMKNSSTKTKERGFSHPTKNNTPSIPDF